MLTVPAPMIEPGPSIQMGGGDRCCMRGHGLTLASLDDCICVSETPPPKKNYNAVPGERCDVLHEVPRRPDRQTDSGAFSVQNMKPPSIDRDFVSRGTKLCKM